MDTGTIAMIATIILGAIAMFWGGGKVQRIWCNFQAFYEDVYRETREFLSVVSEALNDNKISDDEIKAILAEAKDIPVALKKIKDLLNVSDPT